MRTTTFLLSLLLLLTLQGCGGGGGTSGPPSVPGGFTISANTAIFNAIEGLQPTAPQVLHVHLLDHSTTYLGAAYVVPQTQPSWLNVTITGTAPDYDVTLSITQTTLPVGTHSAVVTLGTANTAGTVLSSQNVTVNLTILQPLSVDQKSISASSILGEANAATTTTVKVSADMSTQWTVQPSATWIKTSLNGGTGAASISITTDPTSLPVGTTTGTVTLTDSANPSNSAVISVTEQISAPTLTVTPTSIVLGGTDGLSTAPGNLSIGLNTGTNTYPWTASVTTAAGGNWLSLGSSAGNVGAAELSVAVNGDYAAVSPGSYSGSIQVQVVVKGVTLQQSVPVVLNKEGDWLYVSAPGVALSSFPSRSVLTRTLSVTSSQGLTNIPWSAKSDQGWLSVTPNGMTGGSLSLTANPAGLTPGQEYIAHVTIGSSDSSILNTQQVRVGLWIGSSDPTDVSTPEAYNYLAANPVEPEVYASDGTPQIRVYNVYTGALIRMLNTSVANAQQLLVSSDGTELFVADATNLEVVAVDPTSGATLQTYPWNSGSVIGMAYARPSGQAVLLLGNGTIFNVATGHEYQARFAAQEYAPDLSIAPDSASRYFYVQDQGLSPSSLEQYELHFSALNPDGLSVTAGPSASGGSNGRDLCVAGDGSQVYTANGAPYDFPAFSSNGLQPSQTLPGTAYPNNAACGWNGVFVGGADAYYSATDVWVYRRDGTQLATLRMHTGLNDLLPSTIVLSGDDTRIIGSTNAPSLDFHSIPSP